MPHGPLRILLIVTGICLLGAPALAKEKLDDAVSELRAYLDQCSAKTGYDPDKADKLGDYELHPDENAYAGCAYDGINKLLKARSRLPDNYDRFIAKHKELTAKVKSGAMTRDERKAALKRIVVSIRNQEEALEMGGAKKAPDNSGKTDAQKQMEDMKRVQSTQRQIQRSLRSLPRF